MADKNAEFRALNNNAAAAALYPPAAAASALYPPVTPPSVLYPPAVAPALAPALALFPPSASPSMAAALYPPAAAGAGEGFGYDSAPPPHIIRLPIQRSSQLQGAFKSGLNLKLLMALALPKQENN